MLWKTTQWEASPCKRLTLNFPRMKDRHMGRRWKRKVERQKYFQLRKFSFSSWRINLSSGNECHIIFFRRTQNRGDLELPSISVILFLSYPHIEVYIPVLSTHSSVSFTIFGLCDWESTPYASPLYTVPTLLRLNPWGLGSSVIRTTESYKILYNHRK